MKKRPNDILAKCSGLLASLALLVAVSSVSSTCLIWTYQPDLPEELQP